MTSRKKILVVDDDETLLTLVEENLSQNGYDVIRCMTGGEVMAIVKGMRPNAIILDWKLPDIDGNEVLKKLQSDETTKDTPVIMLTAKSEINNVSEILTLGAKDYIVKPFGCDNLIARVNKVFEKR